LHVNLLTPKGWKADWRGCLTPSGHFVHEMVTCQP